MSTLLLPRLLRTGLFRARPCYSFMRVAPRCHPHAHTGSCDGITALWSPYPFPPPDAARHHEAPRFRFPRPRKLYNNSDLCPKYGLSSLRFIPVISLHSRLNKGVRQNLTSSKFCGSRKYAVLTLLSRRLRIKLVLTAFLATKKLLHVGHRHVPALWRSTRPAYYEPILRPSRNAHTHRECSLSGQPRFSPACSHFFCPLPPILVSLAAGCSPRRGGEHLPAILSHKPSSFQFSTLAVHSSLRTQYRRTELTNHDELAAGHCA